MNTKTKIAIISIVALSVFIYAGYWYQSLRDVPDLTNQIKVSTDHKKTLQEEVSDTVEPVATIPAD